MGNLRKIIEKGELEQPTENSSELFKNMTDCQLEELINKGEVVVSDGQGSAFWIRIPSKRFPPLPDQVFITKFLIL